MIEKLKLTVAVAILICLIVIANKPVPILNATQQPVSFPSQTVVQLGEGRIGIVENANNSGQYGTILVLEFNETTKSFDQIGTYNYADYFRNLRAQ